MSALYWLCLTMAAAFLIWTHTHTDELPIVLGIVLVVTAIVAAIFPRSFVLTAVVLGLTLFVAESLVHFSVLNAPYSRSSGIPWAALTGYVPALLGTAIGLGVRRMMA